MKEEIEKVMCPYCLNEAKLVTGKEIYGFGHGEKMFYQCRPCMAWVGCHRISNKPLGTLANSELRVWRQKAHKAFDKQWDYPGAKTSRSRRRGKAYHWLRHKMNLEKKNCHIAMFDIRQCQQAILICEQKDKERSNGLLES